MLVHLAICLNVYACCAVSTLVRFIEELKCVADF